MTFYKSKKIKWIINSEIRSENMKRVRTYPPEKFDCYQDYFFFVHIDPAQRYIHCAGMLIGLFFYFLVFYFWNLWSIPFLFLGGFFFYGVGVLSHAYYDGHSGRSELKYLIMTTPTVIKINLLTLFGRYYFSLNKFILKYPFTVEAFNMEAH